MEKTIEEIVYEQLCVGCYREKQCHIQCETCDKFDMEYAKRTALTQADKEAFWEGK